MYDNESYLISSWYVTSCPKRQLILHRREYQMHVPFGFLLREKDKRQESGLKRVK
jgi:hypothetical protein